MRLPACTLLLLLFCLTLPVGAQSVTDSPRDGEGIWGMLRRHGVSPTPETVDEFRRLNGDRLRGSDALRSDISYKLPAEEPDAERESTRVFPIFGSKYERVEHKSDRLKGHVYYVVAGHGGPDPGTIGTYGGKRIHEDEVAYDTALRFARRLIQEGATVYCIVQDDDGIRDTETLASDSDETYLGGIPIVRSHKQRLADRAEIINELYEKNRKTAVVQRVISLHVDAVGTRVEPQIDVHFIYASNGGRDLSQAMVTSIRHKYEQFQPGRGYRGKTESRDLMILRDTKPVAVLVELGNIRHRRDQLRLMKPRNRQAIADWMVDGLLADADRYRV